MTNILAECEKYCTAEWETCFKSFSRAGLGRTLLSGTGLDLLLLVLHLVPGLGGLALLRICWARLRLNRELWIQVDAELLD